jgi:hypothetical protein
MCCQIFLQSILLMFNSAPFLLSSLLCVAMHSLVKLRVIALALHHLFFLTSALHYYNIKKVSVLLVKTKDHELMIECDGWRRWLFGGSGVDKKRGTVFEIEAGRVDIGASIQARDPAPKPPYTSSTRHQTIQVTVTRDRLDGLSFHNDARRGAWKACSCKRGNGIVCERTLPALGCFFSLVIAR